MPRNTYVYLGRIAGANTATVNLGNVFNKVKAVHYSLYSNLENSVPDVGSLIVYASSSGSRTAVYYGPCTQSAYGTPTCVYETETPFSLGPTIVLDFEAYTDGGAFSTLTGEFILRMTIEQAL